MPDISHNDLRPTRRSGGRVTRAPLAAQDRTAQPPLASGFGGVIEKERALQAATGEARDAPRGHQARQMERILRHQQSQLGATIALLEQRYEAPPRGERSRPPAAPRSLPREEAGELTGLIARHTSLLADIEALLGRGSDGKRGELILTEVGRHHEEMAGMLAALLKEDAAAARFAEERRPEFSGSLRRAHERWENEGGRVRA